MLIHTWKKREDSEEADMAEAQRRPSLEHTYTNARAHTHRVETVPVLLCCLLLLHLVGRTPPLKWQHTPEGASLVARARRLPLSPSIVVLPVHWQAKRAQCTGRPHTRTWHACIHIRKSHNDTAAQGHTHPLALPLSLRPHSLTCTYICMHPPLTSVYHTNSLSSISASLHIFLKVPSQHFTEYHRSKPACACQSRKTPKGYGVIKWHAGPPWCLLWFPDVRTSYCSGGAHCPGTHPTPSKKRRKRKTHPSFPLRAVCKFWLCCASFMPC